MKKIIVSLLTVIMVVAMMLPADIVVARGHRDRTPTATNETQTANEELDGGISPKGLVTGPSGWPTTSEWTGLTTDANESGCNEHRNVADINSDGYALYYAIDSQYIYLRMETADSPGWPSTKPGGDARYKWWFNTAGAADVSGTSVRDAEFLLILEDLADNSNNLSTSRDLLGELTLMDDLNNDGFTTRWDSAHPFPNYVINNPQTAPTGNSPWWRRELGTGTAGVGGPQGVMGADIGYRIDNGFVDMYVGRAALGNPTSICLYWATDNQDTNLDQAPNCDRPQEANCIMLGKDFGDAPDPMYPTLLVNNGARHTLGDLYLGASVDAELDGIPNSTATGDDNDNLDDEDGVDFTTPLVKGESVNVTITASAVGYLDAWVDFNHDGDWTDAGEKIFDSELLSAGANDLNFSVPLSAADGQTFARFRFSSTGGLSYSGLADDGEVEDYLVTVTAMALEITADSNSKVYDGTPLTDSGYSITSGTLAAGHTLDSVTVTGSQTNVGSSNNVPSAAVILDGAVDVTANYDITYKNGTLTVTKRALEITADSNSKVYDGTPLTDSGYSITAGSLAPGDTLDSVTVTGSQTNVGSSNNVPSAAVILDGAVDVTANYDITYKNGTLTVTKRALEITADSNSKVYDGTPLTDSGYSITAGSLAPGDTIDSVTVTGSQTDVGSSPNVPSNAVIKDGTVDVTASYDISYVNGTLTVTKRALEITADSNSKVYDGTPLTDSGYSTTSGTLATGDTIDSVTITGSQTDVGSSDNVPSAAVILDGDLNDVTASYDITYVNGTLTVTKRALEITADSNSKVYDGTPLTDSGYSITSGMLATGDTIDSVTVTGSQTDVGSSPNVPSNALIKDGTVDVTANYDVTYVNGTLTVTPPPQPAPASGGCPSLKYLTVDWEGNNTTKPLYSNNKLAVNLLGPSLDLSHNLFLERGTHAPVVDERTYYLIVVRQLEEIPPLPQNTAAIAVFNITPADAEFDKNIFLTLGLNQTQLPQNALNVTMAYYNDANGLWETMDYEAGGPNGVAELTLSAPINHFSIYGVLAQLTSSPTQPAHFVSSGLNIVPNVEKTTFVTKIGESVTITANVANDGWQEGTFTAVLKLNGQTVDSKTVTVPAGQSKQVSFTRSGLDYGNYEVEIAGLTGEFTALRTITWWLIIVIIAAIGLIIWGVVWAARRRKRAAQEEG